MSPQVTPPDNEEDRREWQTQMLLQHHADIQRLWRRVPQFPQDHVGILSHGVDPFLTTTTTTAGA